MRFVCVGVAIIFLLILTSIGDGTCSRITNCTEASTACRKGCNEPSDLPYSATFCDASAGSCMCDCRDFPAKTCVRDPDSDCNINCENKNPNPEVFTYYGSFCPDGTGNETLVCACSCFINEDYHETNEI